MKNHISHTEFSIFNQCPYKHYLMYVSEAIPFNENEHLSFGEALHDIAELQVKGNQKVKDWNEYFDLKFLEGLTQLRKKFPNKELNNQLIVEMRQQGRTLANHLILPKLKEIYGNFTVVQTEERFQEEIKGLNLLRKYSFKGFIDIIIKKEDGRYVIIDYKTSTSGWWGRDRTDKMKVYQLIYYKHFWCLKHNIDPKQVDVAFCLLKRKVKKEHIELIPVTSGKKRIDNALILLEKTVNGIIEEKKYRKKNKCEWCHCREIHCLQKAT